MTKCLTTILFALMLFAWTGCDKANNEQAALGQSASTNTNLTISVNVPRIDMSQANGALTNAADNIKEAAGAAAEEARRFGNRVRSELRSDPALSKNADNLIIKIEDDKVTMTGTVNSEAEKQAVEEKVRGLAGGKTIINQLNVKLE